MYYSYKGYDKKKPCKIKLLIFFFDNLKCIVVIFFYLIFSTLGVNINHIHYNNATISGSINN